MSKNDQLAAIIDNMPEYEDCRKGFFEHFHMFEKLGAVNYAALGQRTSFEGPPEEIVGVFLAGMALGRAQEISNNEGSNLRLDVWNAIFAWQLVEDELEAIRPDIPRLPAPAEIEIEMPPKKRKRA